MSTPLDRDIVILNPAHDNYVALDDIGRRIWELLAEPWGVKDLCLKMTEEFHGSGNLITADIMTFLHELAGEGMIYVAKT